MTVETLCVSIWGLQIHFNEQAKFAIWNPRIMRMDYIHLRLENFAYEVPLRHESQARCWTRKQVLQITLVFKWLNR